MITLTCRPRCRSKPTLNLQDDVIKSVLDSLSRAVAVSSHNTRPLSLHRHLHTRLLNGENAGCVFLDHHLSRSESFSMAASLEQLGLRVVCGRLPRSSALPSRPAEHKHKHAKNGRCSRRQHKHQPMPSNAVIVVMDDNSDLAAHSLKHLAKQAASRRSNDVWVVNKTFVRLATALDGDSTASTRSSGKQLARRLSRALRGSFVWHSSIDCQPVIARLKCLTRRTGT